MMPAVILAFALRSAKLRAAIVAIAWPVVACAGRDSLPNDSASESEPVGAETAAATPDTPSKAWTITPSGIGPVRVGMTVNELSAVAGAVGNVSQGECEYARPDSLPSGVSLMLVRGTVARVDVDSTGVRTAEGASVGDSLSRLEELYAGRTTVMPHKYVPGGQYVVVEAAPGDSNRMVFEVEDGRVVRYRAGRVPEVEWVERCG